METNEKIVKYAGSIGIDEIGFADAGPFYDVEKLIHGVEIPFVSFPIERRVKPELTLKNSKGFIVVLEPYPVPCYEKALEKKSLVGNIAPSALGEDYHGVLMGKLNRLAEYLKGEYPASQFLCYTDTSPFSEKHVAVRAGLGMIGKNHLFYSRKYGSRCFIGIILTDLNLRVDRTAFDFKAQEGNLCKSCRRCVDACPVHALREDGIYYSKLCISYLTQQKEKHERKDYEKMGRQIYGCDICQKVCPRNGFIPDGMETGEIISLEKLLRMSNREFKEGLGKTAAGWRGKKQLQKNAVISLLPYLNGKGELSERAKDILKELERDEREEIRRLAKEILFYN
jgi:epoxyqueuosine reductase